MVDISHTGIRQLVALLREEYGVPEIGPRGDPVAVLVQTILSQNTSDINSGSAFRSLATRFASWDELAAADVNAIAVSIRSGGLAEIKALRIKRTLDEIKQQRGELELEFLREMPVPDAERWLLQLPGVGLKTARCVLLFALGKPALPVDTHILRVSGRLGLVAPGTTAEEAHRILGEKVSPGEVYCFHVLVIEHGRRVCRARNPVCMKCILKGICPQLGVPEKVEN